jgi:hypothetical protein
MRSTRIYAWIAKLKGSKLDLLKSRILEMHDPQLVMIQIHFITLVMMFDEEKEAWKRVDLAQNRISIFTFMNLLCTILVQTWWSKARSMPNPYHRTRICNNMARLFGENLNYDWENKMEGKISRSQKWWKSLKFC